VPLEREGKEGSMGEIVLVRHAQANSAARSTVDYDRLSDHGHQQARWLGDWLRDHEAPFDRIICGTLRRHHDTVAGLGLGLDAEEDARLNEIDYFALADEMARDHGLPRPGPDDWRGHFSTTFAAWCGRKVAGTESFVAYESRVGSILAEAAAPGRRVLCVTSGGIIGMAVRLALSLPVERMPDVLLELGHTSVTRLRVRLEGFHLLSYNAYPHFERDDRLSSRTWF
jgi:broad specificity phosphatase PhoE